MVKQFALLLYLHFSIVACIAEETNRHYTSVPGFRGGYVFAQDNSNTLFSAILFVDVTSSKGELPTFIFDGRSYTHWQTASVDNHGLYELQRNDIPRPDAEQIATLLNISIQMRTNIDFRISGVFRPKQAVYRQGDRVMATFVLTNVGKIPFAYRKGGNYRSKDRNDNLTFTISHDNQPTRDVAVGSELAGGISYDVWLQPGQSDKEDIDLGRWCAFDEVGLYDVAASLHLTLRTHTLEQLPEWTERLRHAHEVWTGEAFGKFQVTITNRFAIIPVFDLAK